MNFHTKSVLELLITSAFCILLVSSSFVSREKNLTLQKCVVTFHQHCRWVEYACKDIPARSVRYQCFL